MSHPQYIIEPYTHDHDLPPGQHDAGPLPGLESGAGLFAPLPGGRQL